MNKSTIEKFSLGLRRQLLENILPFWMKHAPDEKYGGFIGRMRNDLTIEPDAAKGLIQNTRILWTFSRAYIFQPDQKYLEMAERAYDYLLGKFWDKKYGGAFWSLDYQGNPADDKKRIYGQAFFIYGLAEYYRATALPAALEKAMQLFRLIEQKGYDSLNGGYIETCNRNWSEAQDLRLSPVDMDEKKSMNNHLHVLEAFTTLYRVHKDEFVGERLRQMIDNFDRHIINPDTMHFQMFFDELWQVKTDRISFGHDIEGSWLLTEAAEVLADRAITAKVDEIAVRMAQCVYEQAMDTDGGLLYEADGGGLIDTSKQFWPQAEAVVGFLNAYQLSEQEHFLDAAYKAWQFAEDHLVDKQRGEWYWMLSRQCVVDDSWPKVSEWKGPYHNSRCCIESLERLEKIKQKLTK
jgi:cellobiose epimerase